MKKLDRLREWRFFFGAQCKFKTHGPGRKARKRAVTMRGVAKAAKLTTRITAVTLFAICAVAAACCGFIEAVDFFYGLIMISARSVREIRHRRREHQSQNNQHTKNEVRNKTFFGLESGHAR